MTNTLYVYNNVPKCYVYDIFTMAIGYDYKLFLKSIRYTNRNWMVGSPSFVGKYNKSDVFTWETFADEVKSEFYDIRLYTKENKDFSKFTKNSKDEFALVIDVKNEVGVEIVFTQHNSMTLEELWKSLRSITSFH